MTILLIEDNPDDAELAMQAFRRSGMDVPVVVKEDGIAAFAYLLNETIALPSLILLDLKLPKVSGIELLRALRGHARTRLIPVVVLTTSREPKDVIECYASANSYVVKPVDFDEFVATMRLLATYWLSINEPLPKEYGDAGPA